MGPWMETNPQGDEITMSEENQIRLCERANKCGPHRITAELLSFKISTLRSTAGKK